MSNMEYNSRRSNINEHKDDVNESFYVQWHWQSKRVRPAMVMGWQSQLNGAQIGGQRPWQSPRVGKGTAAVKSIKTTMKTRARKRRDTAVSFEKLYGNLLLIVIGRAVGLVEE